MRWKYYAFQLVTLGLVWLLWLGIDIIFGFSPVWQEWEARGVITAIWFWNMWFGHQLLKANLSNQPWVDRHRVEWLVVGIVCGVFATSDLIAGYTVDVALWFYRAISVVIVLMAARISRRGLRIRRALQWHRRRLLMRAYLLRLYKIQEQQRRNYRNN